MRVLQIGIGRFGQNHLKAWRKLGVDLVVCDRDERLLAGVPEAKGTDFEALLGDADVVDVVTPAPLHAAMVRAALACGKHVLVEKPVTPTASEGFALAEEARQRGLVLQVGHVFRFAPEAQAIARALRSGAIGTPRYAVAHFMSFKRPRTDGGLAISDGVHFVDLVSWLLGRQPSAVTAVMRDHLGRGMDDVSLLALDYGDAHAVVEAACFPPVATRDLQLMGTEGALACDFLAKQDRVRLFAHAHVAGEAGAWSAKEGDVRVLETPGEEGLVAELRAFVAACESGRPSEVAADGVAGAAAVAVIEAAERSAREGRRVEIELPAVAR